MELFTAYSLPYRVLFEESPVMSSGQDVRIRVTLVNEPTPEAVDELDATVLPFFLLATSGALAGEDIAPWTSTIEDKSNPTINGRSVEWMLKSCNLDERSIVILSQMLLTVHYGCSISEVMFSTSGSPQNIHQLRMHQAGFDPYPGIWKNLGFSFNINEELGKEILIRATFSDAPSKEAQQKIEAELFSWAPGLLSGAYGVAPIPPDECIGIPDDEVVFLGNELEWHISQFLAHPSALKGLVNVFASISHRILEVDWLVVE